MTPFIAFTVDLGWPWWVTTLSAVGVMTVCAAGYFVAPRGFARGVLATLAAEGLVLAVLAPFVMHGGSAMSPAGNARPAQTMPGR
jgi:hypothetical protein